MIAEVAKETVKAPFGQSTTVAKSVQFKGRPGALELQLDEEAPLQMILSELQQLLEQNQQLLGQTTLSLNFGDRPVDMLQYNELRRVIERFGHRIKQVMLTPTSVETYLEGELGISVQLQMPSLFLEAKGQAAAQAAIEPAAQPAAQPTTPQPVAAQPAAARPATAHPSTPTPAPMPVPPQMRQTAPYEGTPSRVVRPSVVGAANTGLPFPSLTPITPTPVTNERRQRTRRPDGPLPDFATQPEPGSENTRPGIVTVESTDGTVHRTLHKVMRTCRAGTLIDVEGDVVVFGDLNPGAEIRATGDIIVFGSLRGMAHAGAKGNTSAIIAAFELSPTQLRLANQIAIAPAEDSDRPRTKMPIEIAYLNPSKQIEVEACQNGKFPPVIRELSL